MRKTALHRQNCHGITVWWEAMLGPIADRARCLSPPTLAEPVPVSASGSECGHRGRQIRNTTERGGTRGFSVEGRKRHILVDTVGLEGYRRPDRP